MPDVALLMPCALMLDRLLGEPPRYHPLVGFGRLAAWLEARLYGGAEVSPLGRMLRGGVALVLLLAMALGLSWPAWGEHPLARAWSLGLLTLCLGARSLEEHGERVALALERNALEEARAAVGCIVSRDVGALDREGVARAATESVLENGADAVFATLFWFLLLGAPGAVLHRAVNTLDAMWGYRTPRYLYFGRMAARLDDVMNYLPARLTALTYALAGRTVPALRCWRAQAGSWYSPNAGPVMAAGAGALEVRLGGAAQYHGGIKERPWLGEGPAPAAGDLRRALGLVQRGAWSWAALAALWWGVGHA